MKFITEANTIPQKTLEVTEMFLNQKGRRYFGIAAASLSNQLVDPKYKQYSPNSKLIQAGISGEKQTSMILRQWIYDKPNCVLIDSINLPINNLEPEEDGEPGQLDLGDTDHLLIIGDNLIIIDSKNWKAKSTYEINLEKGILRGKKTFQGNRPRMNQAKYLWQKYYDEVPIGKIYGFVCISSPTPNIIRDKEWWKSGYKLVNQETLIKFLDELYQDLQKIEDIDFIRVDMVARALTGLVKPYDPTADKFGYLDKMVNPWKNKKRS